MERVAGALVVVGEALGRSPEVERAARYLDELVIKTWATTPTARLDCYYEIYRKVGGQLICEARSGHALVDPKAGLRMRAPDSFHEKFEAFLDRQNAGHGSPARALKMTP